METYNELREAYRKAAERAKSLPDGPAFIEALKETRELHNKLCEIESAVPMHNNRSQYGNYQP